jgi:hypothetical protein
MQSRFTGRGLADNREILFYGGSMIAMIRWTGEIARVGRGENVQRN